MTSSTLTVATAYSAHYYYYYSTANITSLSSLASTFTDDDYSTPTVTAKPLPASATSSSDALLARNIVVSIVVAVLSTLTVGGNLMVIVSFRLDRRLQTVTNYFLLSLSVADLAIGLFSMPLYTAYLLLDRWPLGSVVCDVWLSVDYTMSNASVANLLLISFDRYLSVIKPLTYRARRTPRRVAAVIAVGWIVSAALWTPWIVAWPYFDGGRTVPDDQCYIQFIRSNRYVTIATAVAAFYLPVVVMILVYFRVYRETARRRKNLLELQAGAAAPTVRRSLPVLAMSSSSTTSTSRPNVEAPDRRHHRARPRRHGYNTSNAEPVQATTDRASKLCRCCIARFFSESTSTDNRREQLSRRRQHERECGEAASPAALSNVQTTTSPTEAEATNSMMTTTTTTTRTSSPAAGRMKLSEQSDVDKSPDETCIEMHATSSSDQQPTVDRTLSYDAGRTTHVAQHTTASDGVRRPVTPSRLKAARVSRPSCRPVLQLAAAAADNGNCTESLWSGGSRCSRDCGVWLHLRHSAGPENDFDDSDDVDVDELDAFDTDEGQFPPSMTQSDFAAAAAAVAAAAADDDEEDEIVSVGEKDYMISELQRGMVAKRIDVNQDENIQSVDAEMECVWILRNPYPVEQGSDCCVDDTRTSTALTEKKISEANSRNRSDETVTVQGHIRQVQGSGPPSRCGDRLQDKKALATLSAILLVFLVTWLPYNVFVVVETFCQDCIDPHLYAIGYWLCYVNSTINPVCYALCNSNFRSTYWRILTGRWSSRPSHVPGQQRPACHGPLTRQQQQQH